MGEEPSEFFKNMLQDGTFSADKIGNEDEVYSDLFIPRIYDVNNNILQRSDSLVGRSGKFHKHFNETLLNMKSNGSSISDGHSERRGNGYNHYNNNNKNNNINNMNLQNTLKGVWPSQKNYINNENNQNNENNENNENNNTNNENNNININNNYNTSFSVSNNSAYKDGFKDSYYSQNSQSSQYSLNYGQNSQGGHDQHSIDLRNNALNLEILGARSFHLSDSNDSYNDGDMFFDVDTHRSGYSDTGDGQRTSYNRQLTTDS